MRVTESLWAMGPSGKAVNGSHISSQVWLFAWGGVGGGVYLAGNAIITTSLDTGTR